MPGTYEAVRVSDRVYWVGAVDWGIRDFHGYSTRRGSTYNAYLITGEETILIDTVKASFKEELMSRIASVTDPSNIKYIISNHSEMDHTGALPLVIDEIKPEKVFASVMGVKNLAAQCLVDFDITAVKDGESLTLGDANLTFIETRMLHWPDSMMTYFANDKLLFSQDGFGTHLATSKRFADEILWSCILEEESKYYSNIVLPYSAVVLKTLEKINKMGIDIGIIAPDHGPIFRKDLDKLIELYSRFATQEPTNKAVVAFDTMWGSTEKMARAIGETIADAGANVVIMPLKSNDRSDIITELLDAGAFIVGSPTINNNLFPTVADLLTYAKGLKPVNLVGAAFGSYGWSGESIQMVADWLTAMKVELVGDPLKVKYVPGDQDIPECRALGAQVARRLREVAGVE